MHCVALTFQRGLEKTQESFLIVNSENAILL